MSWTKHEVRVAARGLPRNQPSRRATFQGRSCRDVLQVGLSEADVARAAQAAEPDTRVW